MHSREWIWKCLQIEAEWRSELRHHYLRPPAEGVSLRPPRIPCPLYNSYSSGKILSILGTNDH